MNGVEDNGESSWKILKNWRRSFGMQSIKQNQREDLRKRLHLRTFHIAVVEIQATSLDITYWHMESEQNMYVDNTTAKITVVILRMLGSKSRID